MDKIHQPTKLRFVEVLDRVRNEKGMTWEELFEEAGYEQPRTSNPAQQAKKKGYELFHRAKMVRLELADWLLNQLAGLCKAEEGFQESDLTGDQIECLMRLARIMEGANQTLRSLYAHASQDNFDQEDLLKRLRKHVAQKLAPQDPVAPQGRARTDEA